MARVSRLVNVLRLVVFVCICPHPIFAQSPTPATEVACGEHPVEKIVIMKPELCSKEERVWQLPGFGVPMAQDDYVDVAFTEVPTTATQRLLEIDVTCTCTSSPGTCMSSSGPVPHETLCPQGYALASGGQAISTCLASSRRAVPPLPPPLTNVISWKEGPFRITYDRFEGLSESYINAVKEQICACSSRPTHKAHYQALHARCFGEHANTVDDNFVGMRQQFENPDGTQIRCEILPEELARLTAQYDECVRRNTPTQEPSATATEIPVASQPSSGGTFLSIPSAYPAVQTIAEPLPTGMAESGSPFE